MKNKVVMPERILGRMQLGLLLIKYFLPNFISEENIFNFSQKEAGQYSKDKIIRMFLVHDWAEAYTGDLLLWQRSDEAKRVEEATVSEIDLLGTYDGIEMRGTYRLWKEFEQNSTINAKIANDIDRLENLMQLRIENENKNNRITDFESWKYDLLGRIETPIGKKIARNLQLDEY